MKTSRRFLTVALVLSAAALVLGTWLLVPRLARWQIESAVGRAAGLPCRVGSVSRTGEACAVRGLVLGGPGAPAELSVDRLELVFDRSRHIAELRIEQGRVGLRLGSLPRLEFAGLEARGERLDLLAHRKPDNPARAVIRGECAAWNPLLAEHGRVRFERGSFELSAPLEAGGVALDIPVTVRLRGFLVRSLDGRFEFGADDAAATVRVTGSLREPRVDLGELEPYLGRDFARSFGGAGK